MAVRLSPIWVGTQFFTSAGQPLSGGQIFQYQAGTTTPQSTFTDSTGSVSNANPIILDSTGRYSSQIWFTAGANYKLQLQTATGTILLTEDNLTGINDTASSGVSEWVLQSVPTFISGTSFSVTGNQTTTFQVGRRVQAQINAGFIYGTITASVFSSVTTVTVSNDSGALDATLSAVSLGILGEVNPSIPASITYALTLPNLIGVTNSSNVTAGEIGEVITNSASNVSLSTSAVKDITTISLTAGDWEVSAPTVLIAFSNGTTWNQAAAFINTSSATQPSFTSGMPQTAINLSSTQTSSTVSGFGTGWSSSLSSVRINVSTTTTLYLSCFAFFGVSSANATGYLRARRIR